MFFFDETGPQFFQLLNFGAFGGSELGEEVFVDFVAFGEYFLFKNGKVVLDAMHVLVIAAHVPAARLAIERVGARAYADVGMSCPIIAIVYGAVLWFAQIADFVVFPLIFCGPLTEVVELFFGVFIGGRDQFFVFGPFAKCGFFFDGECIAAQVVGATL